MRAWAAGVVVAAVVVGWAVGGATAVHAHVPADAGGALTTVSGNADARTAHAAGGGGGDVEGSRSPLPLLQPPHLLESTTTTLTLGWAPPTAGTVAAYDVVVAGVSAYTGTSTTCMVQGLQAGTCYTLSLRALVEGRGWVTAPTVSVSTTAASAGGMADVAADLALLRTKLQQGALAEVSANPCALMGYARPEWVDGTGSGVWFRASLDRTNDVGAAAAAVTCQLAECTPKVDDTVAAGPGMQGMLRVAAGQTWQSDGGKESWVDRYAMLPAGVAMLSYAHVAVAAAARTNIALPGCRAGLVHAGAMEDGLTQPHPALLQVASGHAVRLRHNRRLDVDAQAPPPPPRYRSSVHLSPSALAGGEGACFQLNCTLSLLQYLFCAPPSETTSGGSGSPAAAPFTSHVAGAVLSGLGVGSGQSPPARAVAWTTALNYASHAMPVPSRYEVVMKVAPAAAVWEDVRRPRARGVMEEGAYREGWVLSFLTALRRTDACPHYPLLLDAFRCDKLPDKLASPPTPRAAGGGSGVLPPTAPGAATVALGTSAGVDGAGAGRGGSHWSVTVTDTVQGDLGRLLDGFALPTLPPTFLRGILFQLIYSVAVGRHAFGLHHNNLLRLASIKLQQVPLASSGHRAYECYATTAGVLAGAPLLVRRAASGSNGAATSTMINGRSASGDPHFLWAPADAAEAGGGGAGCMGHGEGGGEVNATGVPGQPEQRTSWCVPSADVDGLRVVLHDYSAAALTRKQVEWWSQGFTFPNLAWRDDMHDLAVSVCGVGGERVVDFSTWAGGWLRNLCDLMAAGRYMNNPALALLHPLFTGDPAILYPGLPSAMAVPPRRRNMYAYTPATVASRPGGGDGDGGGGGGGSDGRGGSPAAAVTTPTATGPSNQRSDGGTATDASKGGAAGGVDPRGVPGSSSTRGAGGGSGGASTLPPAVPAASLASPAGVLQAFTPPVPWVARRDGHTITVAWRPADPVPGMPPAATPAAYNLVMNGVSVFSGMDTEHQMLMGAARAAACGGGSSDSLVFEVSAFYMGLGWTAASKALTIPC